MIFLLVLLALATLALLALCFAIYNVPLYYRLALWVQMVSFFILTITVWKGHAVVPGPLAFVSATTLWAVSAKVYYRQYEWHVSERIRRMMRLSFWFSLSMLAILVSSDYALQGCRSRSEKADNPARPNPARIDSARAAWKRLPVWLLLMLAGTGAVAQPSVIRSLTPDCCLQATRFYRQAQTADSLYRLCKTTGDILIDELETRVAFDGRLLAAQTTQLNAAYALADGYTRKRAFLGFGYLRRMKKLREALSPQHP